MSRQMKDNVGFGLVEQLADTAQIEKITLPPADAIPALSHSNSGNGMHLRTFQRQAFAQV